MHIGRKLALACGLGMIALGVSVADDALPDWSAYAAVGDAVGEVVKADENGLTLRISWAAPASAGTRGRHGWHHGTTARGPQQLAQHMAAMRRALTRGRWPGTSTTWTTT